MNSAKWRWLLEYLLGAVLIGVPLFYIEGHLLLKLPLRDLLEPMIVLLVLIVTSGSPMYWARNRAAGDRSDLRPLYVIMGVYGTVFCLLLAYYGARLGVITPETARGYGIAALFTVPLGVAFAFYMHKKLAARR